MSEVTTGANGAAPDRKGETGFLAALWAWLSSMKTAIGLLLALAIASVIGTVIPQNMPDDMYRQIYAGWRYPVYTYLRLTDVYHSSWYLFLLGLIAANLTVCSINRFGVAWRRTFRPNVGTSQKQVGAMQRSERMEFAGSAEEAASKVETALRSASYKVMREQSAEGVSLYAQKGRLSIWGPYTTHLAILVIFLGGVLSARLGFEGYTAVTEGSMESRYALKKTNSEKDLGFALKLHDFNVEFDRDGNPLTYESDLEVYDRGKAVLRKKIDVNHPMSYRGISFYQSSYGPILRISVRSPEGQAGHADFTLDPVESGGFTTYQLSGMEPKTIDLGDRKVSVFVHNFEPNASGMTSAGSDPSLPDPAALVYANDRFPEDKDIKLWKNVGWLRPGESALYKGYTVSVDRMPYWTGLSVSYNPALPVVYAGFVLIMLGISLSFYVRHRVIRVCVSPTKDGSHVTVGGGTKVEPSVFDSDFARIRNELGTGGV